MIFFTPQPHSIVHEYDTGISLDQVAAACLYVVCRQENKPYLLIDLSDSVSANVFEAGVTFLQLCRLLCLENHPIFQVKEKDNLPFPGPQTRERVDVPLP